MQTNDADWVEDVRRWYFNGGRAAAASGSGTTPRPAPAIDAAELGYEAAHPSLQSTHWSRPAGSGFGTLR